MIIFSYSLHLMPPLGGPHRNTVITFGTEKLEWGGDPTVKKSFRICLAVLIEYRRVTNRCMDRQISCDSTVRAMHSITLQKWLTGVKFNHLISLSKVRTSGNISGLQEVVKSVKDTASDLLSSSARRTRLPVNNCCRRCLSSPIWSRTSLMFRSNLLATACSQTSPPSM